MSTYLDSSTVLLEDPSLLVAEMKSTGADVIKFVWEAANITEIATAFDLLSNSQVWFLVLLEKNLSFITSAKFKIQVSMPSFRY